MPIVSVRIQMYSDEPSHFESSLSQLIDIRSADDL